MFPPDTLAVAREKFWQEIETKEGGVCPCCDRFGKINCEPFGRAIAMGLLFLYKHGPNYVHPPSIANRVMLTANNHTKARHWGLIDAKPNDDNPKKNKSGWWRINQRGVAVLESRLAVPSHAFVYNNTCLGFTDELVTLQDALGHPFDFREWKNLGMEDFKP